MDVAVLICGMLREFSLAQRSWNFRGRDCFLVTWDVTEDDCLPLGYEGRDPVGITRAMSFLKGVQIVPHDLQRLDREMRAPYLWRVAERLLRSHEMARGGAYERVFVLRPDIFMRNDPDLETPLALNEIVASSEITSWPGDPDPNRLYLNDLYWLLPRRHFRTLCGFADYWPHSTRDTHDSWARYWMERDISVKTFPQEVAALIARRNSRELPAEMSREETWQWVNLHQMLWWRRKFPHMNLYPEMDEVFGPAPDVEPIRFAERMRRMRPPGSG